MTKINIDEIHDYLVKETNVSSFAVSSFLASIRFKRFVEGNFIELIENWKSLSDSEQSEKAMLYGGFNHSFLFHKMMAYLTKEKEKDKKELTTEIVFILDKSGSMHSIKSDAIGGFNSFLEEQKKGEGKTNMTLVLFNHDVHTVFEGKDINEVEPLNDDTFKPDGMTSLIDAIGESVDSLNKRISEKAEQPDNIIFVIMTDGEENGSREYTSEQVKNKIVNMTNRDYQFIFLGANIDSVETAKSFGIRADFAGDFKAQGNGASTAMLHANEMVTSYRTVGKMASYNEIVADSINNDSLSATTTITTNMLGKDTASTSLDIKDALQKVAERAKEEE